MREEQKKQASQKKVALTSKKWFYPALYVSVGALLIIIALVFQLTNNTDPNVGSQNPTSKAPSQGAVEVSKKEEVVKMPLANEGQAVIQKKFYDNNSSAKEQEAALVVYNGTYTQNTGIDIKMKDDKSFDVVAALSGTVISVQKDPVLGNVVMLEHDGGYVTFYQSLGTTAVEPGTMVAQGQVIGTSGTSMVNKEAGMHVHFEIRKGDKPLNPETAMNKTLSTIGE